MEDGWPGKPIGCSCGPDSIFEPGQQAVKQPEKRFGRQGVPGMER
jgi:hypothetical protein